jgi:hypothetical protein
MIRGPTGSLAAAFAARQCLSSGHRESGLARKAAAALSGGAAAAGAVERGERAVELVEEVAARLLQAELAEALLGVGGCLRRPRRPPGRP